MRILFALSACAWAFIVGRCIAFGPQFKGLWWKARLTSSTWYRLTPLKCKMPHKYIHYTPIIFSICKTYSLAIDDNTVHILGLILLTSAHAFFPIFIIQLHQKQIIASWAFLNIIGNILYASLHNIIEAIPIYLLVGIHTWFFILEIQLYSIHIIRHVPPYEERQPRIV